MKVNDAIFTKQRVFRLKIKSEYVMKTAYESDPYNNTS